jgi:hypothetical protein
MYLCVGSIEFADNGSTIYKCICNKHLFKMLDLSGTNEVPTEFK